MSVPKRHEAVQDSDSGRDRGEKHAFNPDSPLWVCFDLVSSVLLLVDLTMIPYVLAWNVPIEGGLLVFSFVTALIWTCDVIRNFFMGTAIGGKVELRLAVVARRYLRTWFSLDLTTVICDWLSLIASVVLDFARDSQFLRFVRISKAGRLVRICALFRLLRLA